MVDIHPTPQLSIIVAAAQNLAIGKNNDLLWHISDDLKRFKTITSGHTVIMGRRTFDSLPKKPLPKRRNIVLTHDAAFHFDVPEGSTGTLEVAHTIADVLHMVRDEDESFVMGGAALYQQFLPFAQHIYMTWVFQDFDADVFFPSIDKSVFRQISMSERQFDQESGLWFSYADYQRIIDPCQF